MNLSELEDHEVVEAVYRNLTAKNSVNQEVFSRGGGLVVVEGNPAQSYLLSVASLRTRVSRAMRVVRNGEGGEPARARMSNDLLRSVLEEPSKQLPELTRVVNSPFFTADGSLVNRPGYHKQSQTYYESNGLRLSRAVSPRPTREAIKEARRTIVEEMLGDFRFESQSDRANAVALLLLPFVRDMVRGQTPLHDIEAPVRGSGKGKLARGLLYPALGVWPDGGPIPRSEAEMDKFLLATLASSPNAVFFDNVEGQVKSAALSSALTEPRYSGRVLQKTLKLAMPVRCIWAMTGNNPTLSTDIGRRAVRIRIDPRTDRPEDRNDFRHGDIEGWIIENRGEIVWSALTLISGWIAAGRLGSVVTFGSYENWASVMGGILDHAGIYGFMEERAEFLDDAVEEDDNWLEAVELWRESFGTGPLVEPKELHHCLCVMNNLDLGLSSDDARAMGTALRAHRDRVIGGYIIRRAERSERTTRKGKNGWRLVPASTPKSGADEARTRETLRTPRNRIKSATRR